ncbi:MAG: hypothetical protein M3434_07345 [Gemmatimonadota bacterium]|nr:hypothetical protein [Gemmatimonadota bacterium]
MNSDTQNLPRQSKPRNACAASAALYLKLAKSKTEAAIVALQRAEEGDPTLKYALNATRSEALTVVHHINRLLQTLAL